MFSRHLYKKNLAFLESQLRPAQRAALSPPETAGAPFQIIEVGATNGEREINLIDENGGRFYPAPGARTASEAAVSAFKAAPDRVRFPSVVPLNDEKISSCTGRSLIQLALGDPYGVDLPNQDAIVVFGLGLGLELAPLQHCFPSRHIIIVEPSLALFELSLGTIDWESINDASPAPSPRFHFIIGGDPDISAQAVIETLRESSFAILEGTVIFANKFHPMVTQLISAFRVRSRLLISYNGWFEDELQHVKNHCATLNRGVTHLARPVGPVDSVDAPPALIAGSGPSLQQLIPFVKENRDRLLVVSCGSALRVLLTNGVTPHVHCELENVELVESVIRLTAEEYDLSSIALFASTTVVPEAAEPFSRVVHFLRDGLASIGALSDGGHQFLGSGHSVTNSAVALAHAFGCRQILLAGVDFGSPPGPDGKTQSHATGTFYRDDPIMGRSRNTPLWNKLGWGAASADMTLKVPANVGRDVSTNETMLHMKTGLESLLAHLKGSDESGANPLSVRNLGNGARVSGAEPTRIEQVTISKTKSTGAEYLSKLVEEFTLPDGASALQQSTTESLTRLAQEFAQLCDKLETAVFEEVKSAKGDCDSVLVSLLHRCESVIAAFGTSRIGRSAATMIQGSFYKAAHQIRHSIGLAEDGKPDHAATLLAELLHRALCRMAALLAEVAPASLQVFSNTENGRRAVRFAQILSDVSATGSNDDGYTDRLNEIELQELVSVLKSIRKAGAATKLAETLGKRYPTAENLTLWAATIFEVEMESDNAPLFEADPTICPFLLVTDRLANTNPKLPLALEYLALAAFCQQDFARASRYYAEAGLAHNDETRWAPERAAALLLAGEPEFALALYREIETQLLHIRPMAYYGLAAYSNADDDTAMRIWEQAMRFSENLAVTVFLQEVYRKESTLSSPYRRITTKIEIAEENSRTRFLRKCFEIAWGLRCAKKALGPR